MDSSSNPAPITATVVPPAEVEISFSPRGRAASLRELAAIALMVALADITLFRGQGYAGIGALLFFAPAIFVLGVPRPRWCGALWFAAVVLVLIAARLLWLGSPLRVFCGLVALMSFIAAVQYARVDMRAWILALQSLLGGVAALVGYARNVVAPLRMIPMGLVWSIGLPIAALLGFGTLFVLANPDVATWVSSHLDEVFTAIDVWLSSLSVGEFVFWLMTALLTAGLLRPVVDLAGYVTVSPANAPPVKQVDAVPQSPLYPAIRNALLAVVGLFALYLAFEFKTLWLREFPEGFYYAGYAHQGAFWLTVALAMATVVLSLVFRGAILSDPRLPTLRRLTWIWCGLNVCLALAVFNRLFIYVGFNGLTQMRIVGLFGTSAVVAGFALVVWKIARDRDFVWLLRRQTMALAMTVLLYALTPVDGLAVSYNVRRVMAGNTSAVMQIGVQPIDIEGVLALPPLLECDDPQIREGAAAHLAEAYDQLIQRRAERVRLGWTAQQFADDYALTKLHPLRKSWSEYDDNATRQATLKRFHDYAYQWY